MNQQLYKANEGIMPAKGLLKWRDIIAAVKAMRAAGRVDINNAKVTQTANGVIIYPPIRTEAGGLPFDAVASFSGGQLQTRITPGFVFGGISFVTPTINGRLITSSLAEPIQGAPKNIYIKIGWEPIIANSKGFSYSDESESWESYSSVRYPYGVNLLSAEIVWTDADSPEDAGWTASGYSHVPAIIRVTVESSGARSATVMDTGYQFERIAQRNPEWEQGDPISEIYLGGYGLRLIDATLTGSSTTISSGPPSVTDIEFTLSIQGISII